MVEPQNFIDRMLEVENLTDALEDDDADYLLNWGVEQLKGSLSRIEDMEAAGEYANNLMGFMRTLNQIAGDLENIQPESLVQLEERRQKALGSEQGQAADSIEVASTRLKMLTPHQALEYLLQTGLK